MTEDSLSRAAKDGGKFIMHHVLKLLFTGSKFLFENAIIYEHKKSMWMIAD